MGALLPRGPEPPSDLREQGCGRGELLGWRPRMPTSTLQRAGSPHGKGLSSPRRGREIPGPNGGGGSGALCRVSAAWKRLLRGRALGFAALHLFCGGQLFCFCLHGLHADPRGSLGPCGALSADTAVPLGPPCTGTVTAGRPASCDRSFSMSPGQSYRETRT